MIFINKLKSQATIGMFMKTTEPAFIEIAGYAGLDFVIIDMEHGPVSTLELQNNIRAAEVSGIFPIVRSEKLGSHEIYRILDSGAKGIQIPHITNEEDAKFAVSQSKFYPFGERGLCRFVRAANYSAIKKNDYIEKTNNETLLILQLEGVKSLKNVDSIFRVKGIDIIFIGPYDLSQSLGMPGEITNPKVVNTMKEIVNKANDFGIATGTFTDTLEQLHMWKDAGVKYLSYSTDVGLFYNSCVSLKKEFGGNK